MHQAIKGHIQSAVLITKNFPGEILFSNKWNFVEKSSVLVETAFQEYTNLRHHFGVPTLALIPPLSPTVNGPITVAPVGKLSQIVGNLQFMMFPQTNPWGTCFGEKFSEIWDQKKGIGSLKKEKSNFQKFKRKSLALDALHCFTISQQHHRLNWPHFTTIVHHSTPQFMTVVYHPR